MGGPSNRKTNTYTSVGIPDLYGRDAIQGTPSTVDIIDLGDERVISGLPTFNQGLRNLLSNIFTSLLADSAQRAGGGATLVDPNDPLSGAKPNGGVFSSFMAPTLNNLRVPVSPFQGALGNPPTLPSGGFGGGLAEVPYDTGISPPLPQPGASPLAAALPIITAAASAIGAGATLKNMFGGGPEPQAQMAPDMSQPYMPTFSDTNNLAQFMQLLQMFGPGGIGPSPLAGGYDEAMGASPMTAGGSNMAYNYQNPLTGMAPGGMPSGNSAQTYQQTQFGTAPQTQPPASQNYGAGYDVSAWNALPPDQQAMYTAQGGAPGQQSPWTMQGSMPPGGIPAAGAQPQWGIPGMQGGIFQDILKNFSLPGYGGNTYAPNTALQRQATDFAGQFLNADPFGQQANIQNFLSQLIGNGLPFDQSEQFKALEGVTNRRMSEGAAALKEQYGMQGLRSSTDLSRGIGNMNAELLAQENLQRQNLAMQSWEAAANRRMGALPLMSGFQGQMLQNAMGAYNMGEADRMAYERAIGRNMSEWARTQGAIFPWLLQFGLAGTEGDNVILEPEED